MNVPVTPTMSAGTFHDAEYVAAAFEVSGRGRPYARSKAVADLMVERGGFGKALQWAFNKCEQQVARDVRALHAAMYDHEFSQPSGVRGGKAQVEAYLASKRFAVLNFTEQRKLA